LNLLPVSVHDFIRSRRSVRRFLPEPVPEEVVRRIIETATWAPSAHNRQPWRFVELASAQSRQILTEKMGADFRKDLLQDGTAPEIVVAQVERSRTRILQAPAAVLLCLSTIDMDTYPDEIRQRAEYAMAVQSAAMAGGTLLLAALAEGLGGVWICAPLFAQRTVRSALNLPDTWDPQGLILLGYPAKVPDPRPRLPVEKVVLRI
jgi:coenzyme F420-0:L-glutamate ligase / coenzyme F420-1:gamma-L-glutamate ligase